MRKVHKRPDMPAATPIVSPVSRAALNAAKDAKAEAARLALATRPVQTAVAPTSVLAAPIEGPAVETSPVLAPVEKDVYIAGGVFAGQWTSESPDAPRCILMAPDPVGAPKAVALTPEAENALALARRNARHDRPAARWLGVGAPGAVAPASRWSERSRTSPRGFRQGL
jgi:hypothetical protein